MDLRWRIWEWSNNSIPHAFEFGRKEVGLLYFIFLERFSKPLFFSLLPNSQSPSHYCNHDGYRRLLTLRSTKGQAEFELFKIRVKFWKVVKTLKSSLGLIPSPSTSVKFKLWAGKFSWGVKAKHCWTLSTNFWNSLLTSPSNVLPNYHK